MLNIILNIILAFLLTTPCFSSIQLSLSEKKIFSQNGEDGVIEKIFSVIGTTNKYYVEFGSENAIECNTRYLRDKKGWTGLLMDGGNNNLAINLHQEFITAENINLLFEKYQVPEEFDLLSIDIDYNDFYVWQAINPKYKPRLVIIEYNASHLPSEDCVVRYNPKAKWDGSNYFGASFLSLFYLGRQKGYSLVYAESRGVNLFFVRDDIVKNLGENFENINNPDSLYYQPSYSNGPMGGHPEDMNRRTYLRATDLLKHKKQSGQS